MRDLAGKKAATPKESASNWRAHGERLGKYNPDDQNYDVQFAADIVSQLDGLQHQEQQAAATEHAAATRHIYNGNYRLIALMSVNCKLFERVLNNRLTAWTTDSQQEHIAESQVGFQAERSTVDHLYSMIETIRLRETQGRPTYACFVDCRKAFPSVFKAGMLVKLHKQGVRGRFWRMLCSMYSKIETRVLYGTRGQQHP